MNRHRLFRVWTSEKVTKGCCGKENRLSEADIKFKLLNCNEETNRQFIQELDSWKTAEDYIKTQQIKVDMKELYINGNRSNKDIITIDTVLVETLIYDTNDLDELEIIGYDYTFPDEIKVSDKAKDYVEV